jgi:MFS family permease
MVGLFWVNHYGAFIVLLLLMFGGSGVYDVGINAAAVGYEQIKHRRVMTYFHAAFSGGAAAGALTAGLLLGAGMPFRVLYVLIALLLVGVAVLTWRGRRFPENRATVSHVGASSLYRNTGLLLLGSITGLGMLSEGTLESWSPIYLRDYLEMPPVLGASGVAVFHLAMFLGRLGAGPVVARFDRRMLLQTTGMMAVLGMTSALATEWPALILIGFLMVGLGLAIVVPIGFSLAGELAPGRAGEAISVVAILSYGGFLIGPALIGGLAQWLSLRWALVTVIAAGALIAGLSFRVRAATVDGASMR